MTRRNRQRGETEIVVFGRHPVRLALTSSGVEVLEVEVARSVSPAERRSIRQQAAQAGAEFAEVTRESLDRFTGAPRHDQGFGARVRLLGVVEVDAFVESAKGRAARRPQRLIALDGVTNSQNVGMVVRSVVAAGLDGLLWPLAGQPWINGLVVRAATGAIFACPIVRCETLASGLATLQAAGFEAVGLDAAGERSLFAGAPAHRVVYVLGSESRGLSSDVAGLLDQIVSIPMAGPIESLNVAVAAGLVCYHAAGLLGASDAADGSASSFQ